VKGTAETIDNISWYPGKLQTAIRLWSVGRPNKGPGTLSGTYAQYKKRISAMDLLNELKSTYDKLRVLRVDRTSSGPF